MWVRDKIQRLFGRGVGGHDYCWGGGVRGGGQVGVVHEGDVGEEVGAGCEVELCSHLSAWFSQKSS